MNHLSDQFLEEALKARQEHRHEDARRMLSEAVNLCRKDGSNIALANTLCRLGQTERDLCRADSALQHYEEAASLYRAEGGLLRLAHSIRHMGDIHREERHLDEANRCYDEALALYRNDQGTRPLDLANAVRGRALLKQCMGELEQARALWQEARDLYTAVNVEAGVMESSRRIAELSSK